jgi:hypothetical protein
MVVGRLRKDAALWSLPGPKLRGRRGPAPTYGKERVSLAKRAGQKRGWQEVACVQYGKQVVKTIKTYLATWRSAGGVIRVVLVQEADGWLAFFCTKAETTAEEILEAVADRSAIEQTFKDVKEVWGAGQQQVRNIHSNQGCFNLNLWLYSLVETWAWGKPEEDLVERSACRGTGSRDGLRIRTSVRQCSVRSCRWKSKRLCWAGRRRRECVRWPNVCSTEQPESHVRPGSTIISIPLKHSL